MDKIDNATNNGASKKEKNLKLIIGIVMSIIFIVAFTSGYYVSYFTKDSSQKTVEQVLKLVNEHAYNFTIENGEVSITEKEVYQLIKDKYLYYDNYTVYYSPEEYRNQINISKGNNTIIGVSLSTTEQLVVLKVVGNSPAENAGIKVGDKIIAGTKQSEAKTTFNSNDDFKYFASGIEENEQVTLTIKRNSNQFDVQVTKKEFKVSYVSYVDSQRAMKFTYEGVELKKVEIKEDKNESLDDKTAIIKLDEFEGYAATQFGEAMQYMFANGRTRLILDLRDNGGGDLAILTKIASFLIYNEGKRESIVLFGKKRDGQTPYSTSSNKYNTKMEKLYVLANNNSASATECLIGALIHYGYPATDGNFSYQELIIEKGSKGAQTYGKGIMQSTYPLTNGGALKLTTGLIYWPDNTTCIHGKGIVQNQNLANAVEPKTTTTDYAVNRAVELISKLDVAN